MPASHPALRPVFAAPSDLPANTTAAEAAPLVEDEITVTSRRIACDGGGGALGHPRVWLNLGEDGRTACPYCSRAFVLDPAADAASGH